MVGNKKPQPQLPYREHVAAILRLMQKPMGAMQVANVEGRAYSQIAKIIRRMHDEKRIHITEWGFNQRHYPIYIAGQGVDAERPKVTEPVGLSCEIRRTFRRHTGGAPVRRDPLVAALFGKALEKVQEAA